MTYIHYSLLSVYIHTQIMEQVKDDLKQPIEETDNSGRVKRIVEDVLVSRLTDLCETFKNYQKDISMRMYAAAITGKMVDDSEQLIEEFCITLKYKKSVQSLEKHCLTFIDILLNIRGSVTSAGEELKDCWSEEVEKQINVHFLCDQVRCKRSNSIPTYTPSSKPRNVHPRPKSESNDHEVYFYQGQESQTDGDS